MLIGELGLDGVVKMAGPQPQSVVKSMMQSASVLAVPCVDGSDGNRDGLPTVLLEAMALGTPCVSTNVTGIPELVRDQVTGLLVQQKDAESLADALKRCLFDADLRVKMANNAHSLIDTYFDAIVNAEKQRQVFANNKSLVLDRDPVNESQRGRGATDVDFQVVSSLG
jgi:glycosyltransferase involved in cell wall biosynthesis